MWCLVFKAICSLMFLSANISVFTTGSSGSKPSLFFSQPIFTHALIPIKDYYYNYFEYDVRAVSCLARIYLHSILLITFKP